MVMGQEEEEQCRLKADAKKNIDKMKEIDNELENWQEILEHKWK